MQPEPVMNLLCF